jgi:hypothetical protein
MDDLIDRVLHYATMPLWGPACVVMRALDACVGDTYDNALGVAATTAERVAARTTSHDDLGGKLEAEAA